MASSFAEAFKGLDLSNLEEGKELSKEEIEVNETIEILEGWLKLVERKANAKEKFLFAQKHGFLSETHLNLWISEINDRDEAHIRYLDLLDEFEYLKKESELTDKQIADYKRQLKSYEKRLKDLESNANNIRSKSYYHIIMKMLGKKDFSPYGEDLLRAKTSFDSDTADIDIERTIANGYISHKF